MSQYHYTDFFLDTAGQDDADRQSPSDKNWSIAAISETKFRYAIEIVGIVVLEKTEAFTSIFLSCTTIYGHFRRSISTRAIFNFLKVDFTAVL